MELGKKSAVVAASGATSGISKEKMLLKRIICKALLQHFYFSNEQLQIMIADDLLGTVVAAFFADSSGLSYL